MASVESASTSSVGPRYAPDDPTLPKPWKGLIDGSTGLLYYWNPETNVTQYDRPISLNPPLPPGPPPSASTPNLTPISVTGTQTTDVSGAQQQQHGQPVVQQQSSVVQQMPLQNFQQMPYQHTQPVVNQQPDQSYHQFQLPQLQYPQVTYLQGQLTGHTQAQQQQQGSQVPLQQHQGIQVPYQQQQGSQGSHPQQQQQQQVAHVQYLQQQLQGSQVPYQQQQHPPPQLPFLIGQQQGQQQEQQGKQPPEGQQSVVYQQAKEPHSQQIASHQQGQQTEILRIGELGQQEGNQSGFSLPQVQQNGLMPSNHQLSSIATQAQVSDGAKLVQSQQQQQKISDATSTGWQFGGLSSSGLQFGGATGSPQFGGAAGSQQFMGAPGGQQFNGPFASSQQFTGMSSGGMQPIGQLGVSSAHLQHAGMDTIYRQKQLGSPMIPTQAAQSMARPMTSQMGQEEDRREKPGNAFYSSSRNEGPMMLSQQPKLATLPLVRNPQEIRRGAANLHFVSPGHSGSLNMVPGHVMPNMHNHAPFPSAAPLRPPLRTFDSPEFTNINEANAYREHHDVSAVGDNIPIPFMTFEATGFPPEILREMHLAGFSSPTPIQAQTWPVALQSRDIVAIARTGSGKTLGYLIPAFMHLRQCRNNPQFGPTVLVLAPTRELATQIQDEAIKFGRSSRVSCTCLFGGAPKGPQLKEIERGADIIVATPGRLNDILEMRKISFRQISFLVLDEADRMLDMGFEPQIRKIVNEIPPRRQTLMYTATWPKEVRKIAGDLLVNPVQVTIGSVDELAANRSITQFVEVLHPSDRQRRLEEILRSQERGSKIIIFCSTKKLCDDLARNLGRPFGAASIHGDKSQGERDHALSQFRCGRAPILVATDVAARGLDIKDIRVVINYDFPTGIEDYVHRIGRTGRAGATGVSYTFFSNQDWKHAAELIKVLEGANQQVLPELREMAARGGPPVFSRSHGGMNRWDSSDSAGSGRWDSSGGRGYRDRWDSGSGRGDGGRWDPSGGRGGGMRDSVGGRGFVGRGGGGRKDFHGGRGNARGRGFGVPGGPGGWGRHDRGPHDRYYNHPEARGRYDGGGRRGYGERTRGRSYSRSPEKVRTWGYDRNRSDSRSWSRSRSRSRSWSRSRSRSPSRSRSQSRSYDRYNRVPRSLFTDAPPAATAAGGSGATSFEAPSLFTDAPPMIAAADGGNGAPSFEAPDVSGFEDAPLSGRMSPMSPGRANGPFSRNEIPDQN